MPQSASLPRTTPIRPRDAVQQAVVAGLTDAAVVVATYTTNGLIVEIGGELIRVTIVPITPQATTPRDDRPTGDNFPVPPFGFSVFDEPGDLPYDEFDIYTIPQG